MPLMDDTETGHSGKLGPVGCDLEPLEVVPVASSTSKLRIIIKDKPSFVGEVERQPD